MVISAMRKSKALVCLVASAFVLTGCIVNYSEVADVDQIKKQQIEYPAKLFYKVERPDIINSGGPERIGEILAKNGYFLETEKYFDEEIPQEGYFLLVKNDYRPPSLPAVVFGYISISTLTFLPAWSTRDGYDVFYELYQDGNKLKTFDYRIRRTAGFWIVLLPLVWVNLLTDSETDAFESATYQFLRDAKPYLSKKAEKQGLGDGV